MVRISNLELLKKLKENSRISYVDLAKRFGVSETAVRKRMRKLEESGVILKYTVDVNPKKIGFEVDALIGLDTRPEKYIEVIEKLKASKDIMTLCSSTGDHMIMIEAWFANSTELAKFVKVLEKTEGVTKVCPALVVEKIRC